MKILQGKDLGPKSRLAARLRLQEKLIVQVRPQHMPKLASGQLRGSFLGNPRGCIARLGNGVGLLCLTHPLNDPITVALDPTKTQSTLPPGLHLLHRRELPSPLPNP